MFLMINLILFASGFLAVIAQTLLLREILALFAGNELSIGVIFAMWLAGSALGSYFSSRPAGRQLKPETALAASFVLTAFWLAVSFLFIRDFRQLFNIFPGEGIALSAIVYGAAFVFLPLGILAGAQFAFGARLVRPARSYLLESLGYLAGGLLFTFVFSLYVWPVPLAFTVFLLNLLCAGILLDSRILAAGAIAGTLILPFAGPPLEKSTLALAFPGREVVDFTYSPYGRHVAALMHGELTLYSDGVPSVTFPDSGMAETEEFVYLPLLFSSRPKSVLLIGGGGRYLPTILKHKLDTVTVVEQDARFGELLDRNAPPSFGEALGDPRVRFVTGDGRRYLERTPEKYDVILVGLPYPSTLSLNRYYTEEFLTLVKSRLGRGGVFAMRLPGSSVYLDPPLKTLNRVIYDTMKAVFFSVKVVPGDMALFVASDRPLVTRVGLKNRFIARAPGALFVSPSFIDHAARLSREWEYIEAFSPRAVEGAEETNRDFTPRGMLASLVVWQSVFAKESAEAYTFLAEHTIFLWILLFVYLALGRNGARGTAATSGAAGMGLQMLAVWGIGVTAGNIYQWIGLLTACFMGGLSFGGFAAIKYLQGKNTVNAICLAETALCAWTVFFFLPAIAPLPAGAYFLLSLGTGVLVGLEFSLLVANAAPGAAGALYAADLAGGVFAALVFGVLCIPSWGFTQTILFILLLKAISTSWWLRHPPAHSLD